MTTGNHENSGDDRYAGLCEAVQCDAYAVESFNFAMVPVQDILSAIFYMKDGESTYMKDDIILPDEEIKAASWYQQALNDKNMVKVGFYDRNVATSKKGPYADHSGGLSPGSTWTAIMWWR